MPQARFHTGPRRASRVNPRCVSRADHNRAASAAKCHPRPPIRDKE
jgi:hypothetical protein